MHHKGTVINLVVAESPPSHLYGKPHRQLKSSFSQVGSPPEMAPFRWSPASVLFSGFSLITAPCTLSSYAWLRGSPSKGFQTLGVLLSCSFLCRPLALVCSFSLCLPLPPPLLWFSSSHTRLLGSIGAHTNGLFSPVPSFLVWLPLRFCCCSFCWRCKSLPFKSSPS